MQAKDSTEYGWQSISRVLYEQKRRHDQAGPGTPLHPDRPGFWVVAYEDGVGTVLYTGVSIDEEAAATLEP